MVFAHLSNVVVLALLAVSQLSSAQPHGERHGRRFATPDGASTTGDKGGIVYSPYNADGTCKDQSSFLSDAAQLQGFSRLRLYGIDCNQVTYGIAAAKQYGFKLFLGIHNIASSDDEIKQLITQVGSDWGLVDTVSVGNEVVNSGQMSASDVAARVNSARDLLRPAGYTGPVVTVDTFVAIMANPVLCEASDYAAANCHPFFDGKVAASASGDFLKTQSQNVQNACGGKKVLITETGWPSQGNSNGACVPSPDNQAAALSSIKSAMGSNVIYFTAFDDLWKTDTPATFNAEKHWGIQNLGF
ncbi:glycoside hydrolase superfamily [Tuber borchii]|uniref:Glycoside hydrolase superfamily n=1 Tax=Tuber borchii TaxID=42251 RepID=A0A2T6ZVZ2_TUBBO|nr:glycoside hydrolase superfamily [Tuber borchii]